MRLAIPHKTQRSVRLRRRDAILCRCAALCVRDPGPGSASLACPGKGRASSIVICPAAIDTA
ncbi:hypothetical protein [Methylobacterium sp.]|uniref:hypothetical protein n=1 Tax=Methylobacterium sp. TaxID=409 RepID=UPI003AFF634A